MNNFVVQELVTPQCYELVGDLAIQLFDQEFLADVDRFATDIKNDLGVKSVIVNDWKWGGTYRDSGLRDGSTSPKFSRGSQHFKGCAIDAKFKGCSIKEAYEYLLKNQAKYSKIRRIESIDYTPTWLHIDSKYTGMEKIHVFKP